MNISRGKDQKMNKDGWKRKALLRWWLQEQKKPVGLLLWELEQELTQLPSELMGLPKTARKCKKISKGLTAGGFSHGDVAARLLVDAVALGIPKLELEIEFERRRIGIRVQQYQEQINFDRKVLQ